MAVFETFFQIGAGLGIGILIFAVIPASLILKRINK